MVGAVDGGVTVWITLDVRTRTYYCHFGDMLVPLNESVSAWFKALHLRIKIGSSLTLPCEDSEENWIAPELSSTVMGYIFRRCLAGDFD